MTHFSHNREKVEFFCCAEARLMLSSLAPVQKAPLPHTVAVSPDGKRYLWGSSHGDCTLAVHAVATNQLIFSLTPEQAFVEYARFLKDGTILSVDFHGRMYRWSATGDLLVTNQKGHSARVDARALSADESLLVTADWDGQICGWRVADGTPCFSFNAGDQERSIFGLALDPTGTWLLSGGTEGKIRFWRLADQRMEKEIDVGKGLLIQGLAWHPAGNWFVATKIRDGLVAKVKNCVTVYHGSGGEELHNFTPGQKAYSCAVSPDGHLVATAGKGTDRGDPQTKKTCVIHVWDIDAGCEAATLTGHSQLVRDLFFTQDSQWLLSAGWDNSVRIWRLATLHPYPPSWPTAIVALAKALYGGDASAADPLHDALLDGGHPDLAKNVQDEKEHPRRCRALKLILDRDR